MPTRKVSRISRISLTGKHKVLGAASRGLLAVLVLLSVAVSVTGCFKKWDTQEVQEWYEEKPTDFDGYMRLAREKTHVGETERAMKLYADAMNDLQSQFGPDDVRIATCAEELGVLQEKLGMVGPAEENFRRALTVREKCLPPTHLDVKRSKQKLAGILKKLGKNDEAREVLSGAPAKKADATASSPDKPVVRVRRHKRPASE